MAELPITQSSSSSSRAAKRLRINDASTEIAIHLQNDNNNALRQKGIQSHIASFLAAEELCHWDLTCRGFADVGTKQWGVLANNRFGTSPDNGKEGWKIGIRFMKDPILFTISDKEDFGFGNSSYYGWPHTATNQSLLVTAFDDRHQFSKSGPERDFPVGFNGICVRDATNLNYYRTVSSPIVNLKVVICGRKGCEIIITSNSKQLCAIRGNESHVWTVVAPNDDDSNITSDESFDEDDNKYKKEFENGISVLGCESHLITLEFNTVNLYDIDTKDGSLVKLKMTLPISKLADDADINCTIKECPRWSPCQKFFSFLVSNTNSIHIWKFDKTEGSIRPLKCIRPTISIVTAVLSENFVIGANQGRKIFVWDRQTGDLFCQPEGLCDLSNDKAAEHVNRRDNPEDFYGSLSMTVISGDLLISSSFEGNAFCVWNMKQRILLKRYENAFDEHIADPECDVTSMVHLKGLNTFICMQSSLMMAWAFPRDDTMIKRIASIRRRERNITRVSLDLRQGQMRGDDRVVDSVRTIRGVYADIAGDY